MPFREETLLNLTLSCKCGQQKPEVFENGNVITIAKANDCCNALVAYRCIQAFKCGWRKTLRKRQTIVESKAFEAFSIKRKQGVGVDGALTAFISVVSLFSSK